MGRWSRRLAPLFIDFAEITDGERILDVGCGTGNLTFALSQNSRIRAIQGIDLSPIYVEHARTNTRDPGSTSRWAMHARYHLRMHHSITLSRCSCFNLFRSLILQSARCAA
jgi:tRNA1(Val) A37 N6-methylase TrmN6